MLLDIGWSMQMWVQRPHSTGRFRMVEDSVVGYRTGVEKVTRSDFSSNLEGTSHAW